MPPSDSPPPLTDTLQFMQLLWSLSHALDRTSKQMAWTIGVTGPQRLALRMIGLMPGSTAGDLAAILHVHKSTLTGVLQRLEARRLLVRTRDTSDRRRAALHLTPRGVRINATRTGTVEAAVTRALEEVTHRDRIVCRRVIERIVSHLAPLNEAAGRRKPPRRKGVAAA